MFFFLYNTKNHIKPYPLYVHRCSNGLEGLKDQGITNYVTKSFIQDYDALFLKDGEISPYVKVREFIGLRIYVIVC